MYTLWGFPGGSVVKNLPAIHRAADSIPGWRRSPGGGRGNPLQHSGLENPMDRGAWRATVHGVTKSWTRLRRHSTRVYTAGLRFCATEANTTLQSNCVCACVGH